MSPSTRLALLATLSSTPAFAAPFLAIGDNAELYLTASTVARYEDNLSLATDALKQSDMIYEFTPGFELNYGKKGNFNARLNVFENFVRYTDFSSLNNELFNALFSSTYTGSKLSVDAKAGFQQLNQNTRAVAGSIVVRRDITTANIHSEYALTEKTKFGVGYDHDQTAYRSAALTDNQAYTIPVNYYYAISPKVDLSAGFRYRQTNVDGTLQDTKDLNYNVGARGEFTAKLSGNFDVGYTMRNKTTLSDDSLMAVNSGLSYEYSPKTQFTLDLRKDFDTSAIGASQQTVSIKLGAKTKLNEALAVSSSLMYERINFEGGRDDDFYSASLGLDYTVNKHVSLLAAYQYQNNSSNVAVAEFAANVISVSANFRY
jgi:hypothetical protein